MICRGFLAPMKLVARAEGLAAARILEYPPPNIGIQSREQIFETAAGLIDTVVELLSQPTTTAPAVAAGPRNDTPEHTVFRGNIDEVNEFCLKNVWSDGLPVVPPTLERVRAMLRFTDRAPQEVIGVLRPAKLAATVWNVAVNGVMAGCRPETLPVLLALAEAIADPVFHVEHCGTTGGWTTLIILNGPIIRQLDFHSGQGVMRPQNRANITVSRCLRLMLVNIAGYRLGETDMATFGRNYYPVLAEAEDASPWHPMSVDRGFAPDANVVTVQSGQQVSNSFISRGEAPEHLRIIAMEVARELGGPTLVAMEHFGGRISPVLGLTPLVAGILASGGYSKPAVKQYIYEHALVRAREFDDFLDRNEKGMNLKESVRRGKLPARFAESDDPERLVPVLHNPEELQIVVCGSPNRNRSFIIPQMGNHGWDVSKEIRLPADWNARLQSR